MIYPLGVVYVSIKIHTIESAPEAAQEALKAVQNANGFIPN